METNEILIAAVSCLSGILIGFSGHVLNKRRDFLNKKREIRISYLIEAYRRIERGAQPVSNLYNEKDFEGAVADIQLFGNTNEVQSVFDFAERLREGDGAGLQKLLESLRGELRKELGLTTENIPKVTPFRLGPNGAKVQKR